MYKYILLLPLLFVVACGENNSTKYCADGSLAPCNDGSASAQATAPVNPQVPSGSVTTQSGVTQQPQVVYQQAPAQSSGFSWGDAAIGYVIGNMLFGGNSQNETVRERIIERPAITQAPKNNITPPTTSNKNFNNQPSRNATIKPPAAKPSGSNSSSFSAPKSSSFGGSSSRSSGRR